MADPRQQLLADHIIVDRVDRLEIAIDVDRQIFMGKFVDDIEHSAFAGRKWIQEPPVSHRCPRLAASEATPCGKLAALVERAATWARKWRKSKACAPGIAYAYINDYRRNRRDVFASAPTLDALAERLKMSAATLGAAVSSFNVNTGGRPKFGAGPYVALGPVRAVLVHAEGGLAVDREHRVLGEGDVPIPGLYAAGSTGQGGLLLKGHGHHLAWAFVSGRRAGRNSAYATATPDSVS